MAYIDTVLAWDSLVDCILGYPQAERLEEIIGLTALEKYDKLPSNLIFSGGPGTGKSTILEIIRNACPKNIIFSDTEMVLGAYANGTAHRIHMIHDFDYARYLKKGGDTIKYGNGPIIFGATNQWPEQFIGIMPYGSTWMQMTGRRLPKEEYSKIKCIIHNDLISIREYCSRKVIQDREEDENERT